MVDGAGRGPSAQAAPASADLDDAALAAALARAAGERLRALREEAPHLPTAELKDRGDAAAQALLAERLSAARPADAVLSEEAADRTSRTAARRVWIVDPLDGTREFAEGRHDWAVHVALWEAGTLTAGAVALPGLGLVLDTAHPPTVPSRDGTARLRVAVSRSRPPAVVSAVAEALDADLVPMGSAGFKVAAVVRGEVDVYVHGGGQYEWDSAAPVAVARAAGLHASRLDGAPLLYNQPDPYLPDLVVCRPELAHRVLEVLAAHA
ncbi:3'(2'),5'-bisphosphate nucleotidase CysQ [Blastococcus sp. SYSU D00695]